MRRKLGSYIRKLINSQVYFVKKQKEYDVSNSNCVAKYHLIFGDHKNGEFTKLLGPSNSATFPNNYHRLNADGTGHAVFQG